MLNLSNNERIVMQSAGGAVTLTTDRIFCKYQINGHIRQESVMLEQVTSCRNYFSSSIILLSLAGISFVIGILGMLTQQTTLIAMLLVSVLLLLFYVPSRRNVIVIASTDGEMEVPAEGMEIEGIEDFLNEIEVVKHERVVVINEIEVIF